MTGLALDLMHVLVLEDGRTWGEAATPDQLEDARAILDETSGTPYHFLTRARGYSKTTDLAGVALAAMLTQLPERSRCYALAADRDQGRQLIDALEGFVVRTPILQGRLAVETWRVRVPETGTTLEVLAADAPSAWGLKPAFVVVDEIAQWAETPSSARLWEAVSTATSKVPTCRMVALTSAGDPTHFSHDILEHAKADPLWRVHEVPGPPPWMSPERLEEQRRRLPASSFRRLFHNEWTASEDRLTNLEDLRACVKLRGPLEPSRSHRYLMALDVGVRHDRTVAVICHGEIARGEAGEPAGTRVVLDRMQSWQGDREHPLDFSGVEQWLLTAHKRYHAPPLVFDPWQALNLAQRLQEAGVVTREFSFNASSVGRLAVTLHNQIRSRLLALPDDPELIDELASVRLRETSPGVYRLDHDPSRHDDRAVALALAVTSILEDPPLDLEPLVVSVPRW